MNQGVLLRGINDDASTLTQLFREIRKAVRDNGCTRAVLVGHNASFDLGFLNAAVANVAKHSRASRAVISIRFQPGAVAVRVRDDGVGFPERQPGSQAVGRHGLAGMERRVRSCGGRLRIGGRSSVASSGGCVCLVVPLPLSLRVETEVRLGHGHDAGNRETRG
jgi:signal transduction histidine kinase